MNHHSPTPIFYMKNFLLDCFCVFSSIFPTADIGIPNIEFCFILKCSVQEYNFMNPNKIISTSTLCGPK